MEQCSAVQNSSPLLVAASNQVINNQTHTTQSASLNVSNNCSGYVIVGDNIDKNIRPSYQRQDRTTQSLHYFHSYAVLNRLDTSGLSDNRPSHITISPEKIIPDFSERQKLLGDFETLVTRILVEHMDEFKAQKCEVQWHVKSDYSEEMASKSRVVPLGLVLKNEAKLKDMTEILDDLSKYVPVHVASRTETIEGKSFDIDDSRLFQILLFGDQLTVARARGAIGLRDDDTDALHRLEGFVPAVADWHTRMCLLQEMWKRLYSKKGSRDRGTLYQLKNLLNRTAVKQDPSKAMKATEDFLTVLFAYVITAAKKLIEERPMHSHQCNDIARQIVSRNRL
ncbi:uncharacterized protein [Dysidea avara]|uniref:uncharacterized protein isoform X2 n=1 Tax=Dysidea avara TaxID=196820 RepID=UPI00331F8803